MNKDSCSMFVLFWCYLVHQLHKVQSVWQSAVRNCDQLNFFSPTLTETVPDLWDYWVWQQPLLRWEFGKVWRPSRQISSTANLFTSLWVWLRKSNLYTCMVVSGRLGDWIWWWWFYTNSILTRGMQHCSYSYISHQQSLGNGWVKYSQLLVGYSVM